jgi:hypothetical protein
VGSERSLEAREAAPDAPAREGERRSVELLARSAYAGGVRGEIGYQPSPPEVAALQRLAGNRATALAVQRHRAGLAARWLARIGYRLDKPLPPGAPTPLEDHAPDQRRWQKPDFHAFWEAEQGRKLSDSEKKTIDRGCIGITANNLEGGGDPSLEEVYDSFQAAYDAMLKHNSTWWNTHVSSTKYVLFGMLFWSNQDPAKSKRVNPNPSAFVADPATHKVDMSDYKYLAQPGMTNFDYGFWDESTSSFWHANHKEFGAADPMIVYQSTREKFAHHFVMPDGTGRFGYPDFDRAVYGVAVANNYDPTKAKAP